MGYLMKGRTEAQVFEGTQNHTDRTFLRHSIVLLSGSPLNKKCLTYFRICHLNCTNDLQHSLGKFKLLSLIRDHRDSIIKNILILLSTLYLLFQIL